MFRLHVQQNYFNFWLVLAADISINEIVVQHEVGKNIDGLRTLSRLEFKWDWFIILTNQNFELASLLVLNYLNVDDILNKFELSVDKLH